MQASVSSRVRVGLWNIATSAYKPTDANPGGANTLVSNSSAQGAEGSPSLMVAVGKIPKNCTGRFRGKLHC